MWYRIFPCFQEKAWWAIGAWYSVREQGNVMFENILWFMLDVPDLVSCMVQSWMAVRRQKPIWNTCSLTKWSGSLGKGRVQVILKPRTITRRSIQWWKFQNYKIQVDVMMTRTSANTKDGRVSSKPFYSPDHRPTLHQMVRDASVQSDGHKFLEDFLVQPSF